MSWQTPAVTVAVAAERRPRGGHRGRGRCCSPLLRLDWLPGTPGGLGWAGAVDRTIAGRLGVAGRLVSAPNASQFALEQASGAAELLQAVVTAVPTVPRWALHAGAPRQGMSRAPLLHAVWVTPVQRRLFMNE